MNHAMKNWTNVWNDIVVLVSEKWDKQKFKQHPRFRTESWGLGAKLI